MSAFCFLSVFSGMDALDSHVRITNMRARVERNPHGHIDAS